MKEKKDQSINVSDTVILKYKLNYNYMFDPK